MKHLHISEFKKPLMEFLGTFFLIFTIVVTGNALAIAAILMAWQYIGGYVSGAHYNPAVSAAVAVYGRLTKQDLIWYIIAQILGGFAAYLVASLLFEHVMLPHPSLPLLPAFFVELLLAFVLVLIVLTVVFHKKFKGSSLFGFAIAFTFPALVLIGAVTSGGLFNPAIALGASIFGFIKGVPVAWAILGMYVIGALCGGLLAAHAFKFFIPDDER